MLVIDDNMLKLAKMQETLLERSINGREANLEKYKNTVMEIDMIAFSGLLDELACINEHNQSLEEELKFLEGVKGSYEQLVELQFTFKRVCELYGNNTLRLSDLSRLNIEYIDERISVINGYLVNLKNIETNKEKLQILNEQLIEEEKNRKLLEERLLDLENALRESFLGAEGRCLDNGELKYISVVSEYENIGLDFRKLLEETDELDELINSLNSERIEMEEKLKTAEICYNSVPSSDSKLILDEINKEFLRVKYRLTMLKILKLLSGNCNKYDLFKKKREDILDLIKYRKSCLEKLGVRISIDPFSRTKTLEQFNTILALRDNSKDIEKIKKEIVSLSERVEQMINQNTLYMVSLNDTKDLVINKTSMNDIDISSVSLDFGEQMDSIAVLDNQVIAVNAVPLMFNMAIVKQKTKGVIKRVNEMMRSISNEVVRDDNVSVPELVIVPKHAEPVVESVELKRDDTIFNDYDISFDISTNNDSEEVKTASQTVNSDLDLFETITNPFEETAMFVDRTDEVDDLSNVSSTELVSEPEVSEVVTEDSNTEGDVLSTEELFRIADKLDNDIILQFNDSSLEDELPDAFWVTQGDDEELSGEGDLNLEEVSFDEQINALLSTEVNNSETKVRKLTA